MKEYNYNGIRYKRDNNGQWQYFNPTYNKWVYTYYNAPSINGTAVYDSDYLEKAFKAKDPWLKETTTQKVEQDALNAKKAQDRSSMLNNPLIPTDVKIKQISNNAPTVENANTLKQLQVQKQKEDEKAAKQRQLDQQEEARIQALRTSGSDNTRVNNMTIPEFEIKNPIEEWETITKAQKREASRIVNTGDFAKHFPELRDYYLSKENSHRPGGPLTMEEIVLEKIRTDPNFFQTLDNRKFEDFKRREQAAYDDMNFFEKGANMITAFAADPLMTANNVFLRWERPLAYQASMSNEPEALGDDYRYFDKMTGQSESTLNNMLNYINPFRAATHLGQDLAQGDYSGAALNAASIIPMVKGAKAGWKGVTSLMKASPTTLANYTKSNLIKNASPLMQNISNKATVGNLLTGYGGYEAATHYFPEAWDAYSEGDWKKGNENLFMGATMAAPIAMELRASNAIPKTIQGAKGLYNDVATGNSFIPKAWKNPAAGLDGGISETMFNKILQSDDFTSAEKAMLKEYQYGNHPFVKPGPKQEAFNELIGKANLKFPEDAVVTRAFSNPERDFQAFTGAPDDIKTISIQDRPSAFSAGVSNKDKYFYGKTDRIVISGKNLKKLEGNFAKQRYEPLEEGYYTNMPDEELTVIDNSKNQGDSIGDNYYGTQRLTPDELRAQAEAKYLKDSELYTNPENSWLKPSQDPNKLTGQPKSGNPEDGVFTAEESAQIIKEQNERYAEKMRLFSDPANKEEAIQKLISEANEGFANKSGPIDELELFGSGFDMKVVGKFPNKHGGFDYVVQPKNIRKLKKPNTESQPNWKKPSETQLKQEYHVEHELKGNTFFNSEDEFMNAVKNGKVEEITPQMDASIGYRSRTGSKDALISLSKGYRSWPEFRNENTINAIYDGLSSGKDMDMPIVLEFSDGTRRVFSGNTRMDAAFQLGKNPKALVVKVPNNKTLNSISAEEEGLVGASQSTIDAGNNLIEQMLNNIKNTGDLPGPSSNLERVQRFKDNKNFDRIRIDDPAERSRILKENFDNVTTQYKDIWPSNWSDELYETREGFPLTREGQQQAFDEGTTFAKKWMFQNSDKFDELNKAYQTGSEELNQLSIKQPALENALNREMNSYIEPAIREKAKAEFLKRDSTRQPFDIQTKDGYHPEFVKILVEQNPDDFQFQRIGKIQDQLESTNKRFSELKPEVDQYLRMIDENIDPQFRDKIANIYAESLGPNEMMPNLNRTHAEIHMGDLDNQAKLVHIGKHEPSYLELSQPTKEYVNENAFKMDGVNLAQHPIMNDILTIGSKPQIPSEQALYQIVSKSGELSKDPEYVRFVGNFMKTPEEVARINVHETAGHQGQRMLGNWMNKLQEYDPEMLYEVPTDKNELAKLFKEALVEPMKQTKLSDEGLEGFVRSGKTWQSSPQELYADVMIARYDLAKLLMKEHGMTMDDAITNIKIHNDNPHYNEWIANHKEVGQHFKPETSSSLKNKIIKYLPIYVGGLGYGVSQGMNSETPQNRYGGNIKKLSKFIRK